MKGVPKATMIKILAFIAALFVFSDSLQSGILGMEQASFPPRGWNSYDSFCWTISEQEFLQNALLVHEKLQTFGYEYVVVDYLWYRRKVDGANVDSLGYDVIDEWGRVIPDPVRWPSSVGGIGFSIVANEVHQMNLKFGIHVMRGISTQAVNANTPVLDVLTGKPYEEGGRTWYAKDIGVDQMRCGWMQNGFMSVDTSLGAGRAFLRSLYYQYAEWNVDFVKHDCVFGDDLNVDEISFVSQVLKELNRPILHSLSPGTSATPSMAQAVSGQVNMYRIAGDDWDTWPDVAAHFDVARDFAAAQMIGANGLNGKSWPDLDMLPLGWLTDPGSNDGPHRYCRLPLDEQRTQMTLWSMAKSPLMFGGDMRNLDDITLGLLINPTLLEINSYSSNNMEFASITSENDQVSNNYKGKDGFKDHYLGLTSCDEASAKGWSAKPYGEELPRVCWRGSSSSEDQQPPFCLYKRGLLLESHGKMKCSESSHHKLHLSATERPEFCLGASRNRKLTSKEFRRGSFSPCRLDADQTWEFNHTGTLKNSYSGSCASVNAVKAQADDMGIRSWLATGRTGETYVAFFNLNSGDNTISAKISDIAKAIPGGSAFSACICTELWTQQSFGVVSDSISMAVRPHASALFTLTNCN